MPGLRDEITKTLLRLSRGVQSRPASGTRSSKGPSAADSALREEHKLGSYRIINRLGAGGMGHVYLALDTRLGRHVALKFLSPDLTADEEMLRRLAGEAQTASRLNHPNILTIYDVGQLEGEHYIASEYVDGATLRSALERHAVDPATAIDIVSQVLSALVAAHAAGVIHRDLKPGNIMIRHDGYVKVIDFGLAKHTRRSSSEDTWADTITRPGSLIGTVDYMSPEQARGAPVDHRTDLWSLGVILYEAVTRHRPFDGDTENHVIVNILDKPVPPIENLPDLPAGLSNIIRRALAKNPNERYQTAREMLADLQTIQRSSHVESSIHKVAVLSRPQSRRPLALVTVLLASLVALGTAWWLLYGLNRFLPKLTYLEPVRQLTFNGRTQVIALSHDGNYLAFAAGDTEGIQTLYLKPVNSPIEGEIKIPARKVKYVGLTFSPDDQSVFEVEEDESLIRKLYVVPIVGSRPDRPILTDIDGPVAFAPDGQRFAFIRFPSRRTRSHDQAEDAIYIASCKDLNPKRFFSFAQGSLKRRLAWSPKGDRIAAFLGGSSPGVENRFMLVLLDMAGHQTRWLLPQWRLVGQPRWTDDGEAVIVSAATDVESDDQAQLRQIDAATGRVHDITKELFGFRSLSTTDNGKFLAAIRIDEKARVWISENGDFRHGTSSSVEVEPQYPNLSWFDEQHLILNSKRSGYPNFWLFDVLTQGLSRLTEENYIHQRAVPIPGERSIVFTSNRSGQFHLWRLDLQTNQVTQLTFGSTYDQYPVATPDGQWVFYTSWDANNPYLYKVPAKGGSSMQIGSYMAEDMSISPDGKWIACRLHDPVKVNAAAAVIDVDGLKPPRWLPNVQTPLKWMPRTNQFTGLRTDAKGVSNIWTVPLDHSTPRQLTNFDDQNILNFEWSPSGNRVACLRVNLGQKDAVLFRMQRRR